MSEAREAAGPDVDIDTGIRLRGADTWPGMIAGVGSVVLALIHIYFNTFGTWSELWVNVIHFGGFGALCALIYPAWRAGTAGGRRMVLALDCLLAVAALACIAYLILGEEAFFARGARYEWYDWLFTAMAPLLAMEFIRRTTGMLIPGIMIVAFSYVTLWGKYVPGMLTFPGLSLETMLYRTFYTDDGMLGNIASISATYVFMFVLFGAFLSQSGAGDFIIGLARAVSRRLIGGPGYVAVFGSALMGSISGSSVANVAATGVITIPMMQRAGFPARFAAAVEAAASTGGQIMPPVMGAGAFVMASYTNIPYLTIAAVAFLPACLYFWSVACYVRIQAKRLDLAVMDDDAPSVLQVIREGGLQFFFPIATLLGLLISGFTPTYCAGIAIVVLIASSWLRKGRGMGPMAVCQALIRGTRDMILTAVLLVGIGVVVNSIATTGIGNTFSLMINQWADGNLFVALVLVALASLVLGMGLPVTAAYVVLATLSAPAIADLIAHNDMVTAIASGSLSDQAKAVLMLVAPDRMADIGKVMSVESARELLLLVPPDILRTFKESALTPEVLTIGLLSAHMIIFWLSQDSGVTPPVCLTAFAAAAIAKTPPMATGFVSWKLAKGLYIVPFLFAYTPLMGGNLWFDLEVCFFAAFAIYALAGALDGHLEAPVGWPMRAALFALGVALMWPHARVVHLAALALFAAYLVWNVRASRRISAAR
ncbi:MAG: TRAP transporter fused permease subunit [Reyranella sp.]|uniref:TRAP transporter permease n=1 Tax=Reyranella sp. TaxID=1929291 RepID=UPI002731073F|nr:TRAP transporter fused permease subunit [Reyranella sp.]MDP1962943.1 TRAP transporter fused permease subunit [Reyranella sp.]MDP2375170.1 TRAP transporter fused permease subunit [Reyranella sp.]